MIDSTPMPDRPSQAEHVNDVDTALLDADLFIKYKAPDRAIKRLRVALEANPRSIPLREKVREICVAEKQKEEGARQCLALASLYIERDDFESAYDRLIEAKHLDARINIAGGLEAIRRARRPDLRPDDSPIPAPIPNIARHATLAGDLSAISVFDAIQVVENAKLTGTLLLTPYLTSSAQTARVMFNEGRIVDAEAGGDNAEQGFRRIVEITKGSFEFHKSAKNFPRRINALSNTNLVLDTLSQLDEEKR
jgi:hypothetical protein